MYSLSQLCALVNLNERKLLLTKCKWIVNTKNATEISLNLSKATQILIINNNMTRSFFDRPHIYPGWWAFSVSRGGIPVDIK